MSRDISLWLTVTAFLLLVTALPLISFGTTRDDPTLWWLGLVLLTLGGLLPPIARYAFRQRQRNDPEAADTEQPG